MRRSPPALSCILGYDLRRKRPIGDLTPEEPEPLLSKEAEEEAAQKWDMTLVVEETPSSRCDQVECKNHNPHEKTKK